jgi:peptide/nickel transport system substrate-binding protein
MGMAPIALVVVLLAGCTSTGPKPKPSGSLAGPHRGGTLRVGYPASVIAPLVDTVGLDPQVDYFFDSWELFRCCLLRTLLGHRGRPTRDGGAVLRPDLATAMPEISSDSLTWTFHIRSGLHYAPPLQNVEITAGDFIRALQREAQPKIGGQGYSFYYSIIAGFDDYGAGRAASIAGLEAPDPHTLRVHLSHPAGDLGDLFALAATAPIPPNTADASPPFGVAEGHDGDYGKFLVSSGPYMLDGSPLLDFTKPPQEQVPVAGYVPKKSIVLVRNPSWVPATDPLRPAYVDRIEIRLGGSPDDDVRQIDQGMLDLTINGGPPIQAPLDAIHTYQNDPSKGTVDTEPRDFIRYVSMNLALPPFDDIHVRKAVNYVVDKQALIDARGGSLEGNVINHVSLDSLENNLLLDYDPYPSPGNHGAVAAAKAEMAMSQYDRNHDGICDAPVCRHVLALSFPPPWVAVSKSIARDLRQIGIDLDVQVQDPGKVFASIGDPKSKVPLALNVAWGRDILNASNYFEPLFDSSQIGNPAGANYSLLGASSAQLRRWGYAVRQVPNVDGRIDACLSEVGQTQLQCWSGLDQYLMENVVPWVPYVSENHVQLVPSRITHYSYDQSAGLPALEQIALSG